jgi:hypothetical protein
MEELSMKTVNTIVKILAAIATVAGTIYLIATYGDKIVAWAKKLLASCPCKCNVEDCADCECECECECDCECKCEEAAEEAPAAEEAAEEAPIEEVVIEEPAATDPVADETDFEA